MLASMMTSESAPASRLPSRDGSVKLTSVYRDTYSRVDSEGKYHKLNEAYFLGGHKQAVAALESNFDLKIDDYVSFNWAAVAKGITALGGVSLNNFLLRALKCKRVCWYILCDARTCPHKCAITN